MPLHELIISYLSHNFPLLTLLISLTSNAIPYLSLPYLAIVLTYSSSINISALDCLLSVLCGGIGAACGKIVVYLVGKYLGKIVLREQQDALKTFSKLLSKGIFIAILVFTISPLPDDIILVPAGIIKYSLVKYFTACLVGKTVLTGAVIGFGRLLNIAAPEVSAIEGANLTATAISIVFSAITIYVMRKVDWNKILQDSLNEGVYATLRKLLSNLSAYMK